MDLSQGEWEVGLNKIVFPTSLVIIPESESFFDLLICLDDSHTANIADPDTNGLRQFILVELYELKHDSPGGSVLLKMDAGDVERLTLVPWSKSNWVPKSGGYYHTHFKAYRIRFRPGPYPEPDGLIAEINEGIQRCMHKIYDDFGGLTGPTEMALEYSRNTKKVKYQISGKQFRTEHPYAIRFAESMGYKLGFGPEAFLHGDAALGDYERGGPDWGTSFIPHTRWLNVDYHCPNLVDLYDNLHEKYIYCDVIESQLVGGNALKLLKVVSTPPQRNVQGASGRWDPQTVQYMKVGKKYFDTIEIDIRNPLGDPFPFSTGKLAVVLHFRRIY